MLFLDGVYVSGANGNRFRWVKAPSSAELTQLAHRIAHRVGRFLERQGLLEQDVENSYLASDAVDEGPMDLLLGHSITYRIAVGPQQGCKVFTLQTLPACDPEDGCTESVGKVAGFSLHAGVAARADERKTPYRDGTTHVIFEPLDFIARLAALIPKPRVNLTHFHGVFAPNSKHRSKVTPASQLASQPGEARATRPKRLMSRKRKPRPNGMRP